MTLVLNSVAKKMFAMFLLASMLGGCAKPWAQGAYYFDETVLKAVATLPCESAVVKGPYEPMFYDFVCTGGKWEQLSIRADKADEKLYQMKVYWKRYPAGSFFYEDDAFTDPFVSFITKDVLKSTSVKASQKFKKYFYEDDLDPRVWREGDVTLTFSVSEEKDQLGHVYQIRQLLIEKDL